MGEGTDRPMGERRRRREAERAAATPQPLTRRELRRREAEEAARLEAIATGELPLDELAERMRSTGATKTAGAAPSAPSTSSAVPSTGSAAVTPGSAASPAARPSGTGPRLASRRSLRDRAPDPAAAPPERPQERTATGRRPVVRTPSTAQGVRALDSTGRLTGIQPVVRPDAPHPPDAGEAGAAPPTERGEHFSLETDEPVDLALPSEQLASPAAETADHVDEGGDDYPLRPQWVAINHIAGGSPDEAKSELPARRTRRERPEEDEPAEAQRNNPAVTFVKVAVLALVALIIGALIWLLATEAFAAQETAAPASTTYITTPHPEEFRAR